MIYKAPPYKPSTFARDRRNRRWAYLAGCALAVVGWASLGVAIYLGSQ